jgi:ABC-2 type transport system ATP-binding protein
MIVVEKVARHYGQFVAVNDVSFSIERGEVVGLLGHNGAGKTTLMKMITGYLEPHAGRIGINGKSIIENPLEVQKLIGYLPESSPLYPDMTVVGYLEYVCDLRGILGAARPVAIRKAIHRTHLGAKAQDLISTLSRGYRQRLGVAQAIVHEPEILILDEPTNGLDPSQIQDMRTLIRELSKTTTVILSTHILQEVQAMCDRVIVIQNGSLAIDSSLEALQQGSRIRVVTDKEPDIVCPALDRIDGVSGVDVISGVKGKYTYSLALARDADGSLLVPLVAKHIVQAEWSLFELVIERRTLEAVFQDVTQQKVADTSAPPLAA